MRTSQAGRSLGRGRRSRYHVILHVLGGKFQPSSIDALPFASSAVPVRRGNLPTHPSRMSKATARRRKPGGATLFREPSYVISILGTMIWSTR
jgi:hypothetical protein